MKPSIKVVPEVKNHDIKDHLEKQDRILELLKKATNQIVGIIQEDSHKIAHLFRWKERERIKQSRVSFQAANLVIRITSVIGYIVILLALVYGGYKLFNW